MNTRQTSLTLLGISFVATSFTFVACSSPPNHAASSASNEGGSSTSGGSAGGDFSSASTSAEGDGGAGGEGGGPTPPVDILVALKAIPGLSVDEQPSKFEGYRRFILEFDQPADHNAPSGQRFKQHMVLQHRATDLPLVIASTGYGIIPNGQYFSEPAALLRGNALVVEHRFFTPSRPEPPEWGHLTIEQAAADHHRIITALKPIYTAKWVSTGTSKGGMTSVYHRRFYPDDVDATVAYVAPESFGTSDPRYLGFLEQVGDAACRDALKGFQKEALSRRPAMVAKMQEEATAMRATYDILGLDRALESAVIELPFTFWQYFDASLCATIPTAAAVDDAVWAFLGEIAPPLFWSDDLIRTYEPYYFQAATQLGYPAYADDYLAPLLMYPDLDVASTYVVPGPGKEMVFHPESMKDVASWVATSGRSLVFIYGQNDPYSAAAFDLGNAVDSYRFFVAAGNHGARILTLSEEDKQKVFSALYTFTGVKPVGPSAGLSKTESDFRTRRELLMEWFQRSGPAVE